MIHIQSFPGGCRRGLTIIESVAVMVLLGVMLGLVGQFTAWNLAEQRSSAQRQAAMEGAANLLEAARATAWEDLTPAWASRQQLSDALKGQLVDAALTVEVKDEPGRDRLKRVTVELRWATKATHPPAPFRLVGVFAPRTTSTTQEKP
jgi:type II secretory pathway pseudopilin PulG